MLKKALATLPLAAIAAATLLTAAPAAADPAWQAKVVRIIADNQSYPRAAQMRKEEGTTRVRVSVDASGTITNVEVAQGSGSDTLDREAERMFQKIGTFPKPPAGAMTLVVPVTWRLN
jgi:protein TonB